MTRPTVLIIEDDPAWQELLAEFVADAGFRSVVAATVRDAVARLGEQVFALAVVDISLSLPDHADRGGVSVLRAINQLPQRMPAIVVTGYATIDLAIETLAELNASYFFRKEEFDRRKFIDVVQKITIEADPLAELSDREREVLHLMAAGLTNRQIAAELTVTVNTIKKHTQNIFTKLNVESRTAAVARAFKRDE
ncbi:MAG: Transcriptional regulatory protein FixJ [Anaerolineae bacterium]|nr:Transcriptional regulatory protein FixJ [Anaerolineae bacterium]